MKTQLITYILAIIFCCSCVDQIEFDVPEPKTNFLIVDGFITNHPGPHTVRLGRPAPFKDVDEGGGEEPINDATVEVYDVTNNVHTPLAITDVYGNYQTPFTFQGIVGNRYQLKITLSDGKTYESDIELLPEAGIIDDSYFKYHAKPVLIAGNIVDDFGVEGFVDFSFKDEGTSYYLWDWEVTYLFETANVCYVTEGGKSFSALSDNEETTVKQIKEESIMFEQADFRFYDRLSYRAMQYSTTKNLYDFFKKVEQQDQATGSIFDPTPATIIGNIKNPNDSEEIVLGYFGAFGLTDARVFITRGDIFHEVLPPTIHCDKPFPPKWCQDCLCYPSSTYEKPDFWD